MAVDTPLDQLRDFRCSMQQRQQTAIGIPVNLAVDYSPVVELLGDQFLNNIGDPYVPRSSGFSTQAYEREVLTFFADLYGLAEGHFWGYVTSGSTEGNLSGLWLARERFPRARLYSSQDSHYSVGKIARLLRIEHRLVASQTNGELDYAELDRVLERDTPDTAIINLNIGTTMKGAIDDIERVLEILDQNRVRDFHIHCDAALFGAFLPMLETNPAPGFDRPIDSLAISGYKFIGSPFPCGLVLTRQNQQPLLQQSVEYNESLDSTFSGSRNGHAPVLLWYALKTRGYAGLQQEARRCIENAGIFRQRLQELSWRSFINPHSNIVVMQRPRQELVDRWRLLSEGDWSHIVAMQHVTRSKFEQFAAELVTS